MVIELFKRKKLNYTEQIAVYRNLLTENECKAIFEHKSSANGVLGKNTDIKESVRKIEMANKDFGQNFNFSIRRTLCDTILSDYTEGQELGWHQDILSGDTIYRKISTLIHLNKSNDYEGGEISFFCSGIHEVSLGQGDVICYLPFVQSRVSKVKKGILRTLTLHRVGKKPYN